MSGIVASHHPSETTLLAYAAGTLPLAHRRVMAVHLAFCVDCAADIGCLEAAAGAMLDALPPAKLAADALTRALARLDGPKPSAAARVPATVAALATGRWRWTGPGIAMMPLIRRDASDSRLDLIRVAPGTALLEHGHTAFETTVVLEGAFDDGISIYQAGDFSEADGALDHQPRALPGVDCVCLVATSGHLRPRGFLGRVIRPLLGM